MYKFKKLINRILYKEFVTNYKVKKLTKYIYSYIIILDYYI